MTKKTKMIEGMPVRFEITKESMQRFLEQYGNFIKGVQTGIMTMADQGDGPALEHFRELLTIYFTEAVTRLENNQKVKHWKVDA